MHIGITRVWLEHGLEHGWQQERYPRTEPNRNLRLPGGEGENEKKLKKWKEFDVLERRPSVFCSAAWQNSMIWDGFLFPLFLFKLSVDLTMSRCLARTIYFTVTFNALLFIDRKDYIVWIRFSEGKHKMNSIGKYKQRHQPWHSSEFRSSDVWHSVSHRHTYIWIGNYLFFSTHCAPSPWLLFIMQEN